MDIRRSITVPVPPATAFRIFTEHPDEWLPPGHTFLRDPVRIAIETSVGGRFYERAADGTEITRGTVLAWVPPERLVLTWRIGADWRPVDDDERASRIEVAFVPAGPDETEVVVTNSQLHRHGAGEATIRAALDRPGPGETLLRYEAAVSRLAR
jgi:uncharacterized protein YndB with AHSA1/START domain